MTQITIRPLSSHEDYQKTRQIHMAAWGVDAAETIPPLSMHAFQHNGGILLGAYDGQQLVGYSLGTLGAIEAPNRIDQVAAARLKLPCRAAASKTRSAPSGAWAMQRSP